MASPSGLGLAVQSVEYSASMDISDLDEETKAKMEKEQKGKEKKDNFFNRAIMIAGAASFLLQIIAMAIEATAIVYIAGFVGLTIAPVMIMQESKLGSIESLRQVYNRIRNEVNRLKEENDMLDDRINDLEVEVGKVNRIESELKGIVEDQGTNVDNFVYQVKENGNVVKEMQKLVKADFEEQLLSTLLRTDRNDDLRITDAEVDILLLRLKNQDQIIVNEELFRKCLMKNGGHISAIVELFGELEKEGDHTDQEDAVLKLNMENIMSNRNLGI